MQNKNNHIVILVMHEGLKIVIITDYIIEDSIYNLRSNSTCIKYTHTFGIMGYKRREVTTYNNINSSKGERQQVDKISTCIGDHCSYFNY